MALHALLTAHPTVKFADDAVRAARGRVDAARSRDRAALGAWDAQSVAAARNGEPGPALPESTSDVAARALHDDVFKAQQAVTAVLRDVAHDVEDELLRRQAEVFAEVDAIRVRLASLAVELSSLGGTAEHLDRAAHLGTRGHLTYQPDPADLLKVTATGTVWVQG